MNTTQHLADSQKPSRSAPYTEAQVRRWLSFLARNMQQHEQTVFLIEQLQPTWLPTRWQHWCYLLSSRMIWIGLIGGLIFGLIDGLTFGLINGLIFGLIAGVIDITRAAYRQARAQEWSLRPTQTLLLDILIIGFVVGQVVVLVAGLFFDLYFGLVDRMLDVLTDGLVGVLVVAQVGVLVFVLAGGFLWNKRSTQRSPDGEIRTVETMKWSWRNARRNGRDGLVVALLVLLVVVVVGMLFLGLVGVLFLGLVVALTDNMLNMLFLGLVGVLVGVLLSGLISGLVGGLTPSIRKVKTRPNQGIWLTIRYAIGVGSIVGMFVGLLGGLFFGDVRSGIIIGIICGLLAGLWFGGFDVLQHGIIRLLLWWRGDAPLNYARFLDYAASELHFLQKVGGGYIFVHRYLLEHFAAMAEEGEQST